MTHLDQRLWTSEDDGQEYIHVLWGDAVYTGRMGPHSICFSDCLPDGAMGLLHKYMDTLLTPWPPALPDYTLAA